MSNENRQLIVRPMPELKATANRELRQFAIDGVESLRKPAHEHGSNLLDCLLDMLITLFHGPTT